MPSREDTEPVRRRVRRTAADRRAEIVSAATRIALRDGLESVTLRSIGEELGVAGSLINHYFDSIDDLLAEAFANAAHAEIVTIFGEPGTGVADPLAALIAVLAHATDAGRAEVNLLWIDAWHLGRRRAALHDEVVRQSDDWTARLAEVIAAGVGAGDFHLAEDGEPRDIAAQIMAIVDGLTVQSSLRRTIGYDAVARMGFAFAETQLGLATGTLAARQDERTR